MVTTTLQCRDECTLFKNDFIFNYVVFDVYLCTMCAHEYRSLQKSGESDPMDLEYTQLWASSCGCWDLSSGLLQ